MDGSRLTLCCTSECVRVRVRVRERVRVRVRVRVCVCVCVCVWTLVCARVCFPLCV